MMIPDDTTDYLVNKRKSFILFADELVIKIATQ